MTETRSARHTVLRGRALVVHVDDVLLPDGRHAQREIVEHPGSVVLVPVDAGRVLLVRQYRYAVGSELLELPAGTLEPGEAPLQAAHRELAEETAQSAGSLELLAELYPSPGYTSERMWFYLATGLAGRSGPTRRTGFASLGCVPRRRARTSG